MSIKYQIADLITDLKPKYEPLLSRAKAYCLHTDQPVQVPMQVEADRIREIQDSYGLQDLGLAEYQATASRFYSYLILHQGILLHASAVVVDGGAYLFSANSGVGKSTHTALWLELLRDRAYILNDDKPAIRVTPDGIFAYGTPWSGKSDLNRNEKVPLKGICFLEREEENKIEVISPAAALVRIYEQTIRIQDVRIADCVLSTIEKILMRVPTYRLCCRADRSAAALSYQTMTGCDNK